MLPFSADAALIWNWSVDNQTNVVGPEDTLSITGTIFNDPSSTVTLQGLNELVETGSLNTKIMVMYNYGDTLGIYYAEWGSLGSASFSSQFEGVVIAPGESYSFDLYTLIPGFGPTDFGPAVPNPAPPGTYVIPYNGLSITGFDGETGLAFQDGGSVEITVVPVPAAAWLFGAGLLSLIGFTKRKTHT